MVASVAIPSPRVVDARIRVPGSKSITNRALVCAALAAGTSRIVGGLASDDTAVMRAGLGVLGARIVDDRDGWSVVGFSGSPGAGTVDAGASGTTMRFLAAVAALGGPVELDGTARMRERPLGPLLDALGTLGARIETLGEEGYPPVRIAGPLGSNSVRIDGSISSQFVTALLLVGPVLPEGLRLEVDDLTSAPYLQTTKEVMESFGATVDASEGTWLVEPTGYRGSTFVVEPDASAAVYPWVGAAVTGGAATVVALPGTSSQADMGVLEVLEAMGAVVERGDEVTVRGPVDGLVPVEADLVDCPDGAMAVIAAAATASGTSRFWGLATLRRKETDRLEALATELRRVGASVEEGADWIVIGPGPPRDATVETYDDHRMAMSFAMLGLARGGVSIADPSCVAKTWPGFWDAIGEMARPMATEVVAIDGPAGTGKTTVAAAVAEALGGARLDTGAFYRSATLLALRSGADPSDGPSIRRLVDNAHFAYADGRMRIDGEDVSEEIRTPEVNGAVSAVSAQPVVREALVRIQRRWAADAERVTVVEGRDIGTVVFPDARLKVYLDARPEVRARRRAIEAGTDVGEEAERLAARDALDSGREASPLRPADDAWRLDTSDLSVEGVVDAVVARWVELTPGR